MALRSRGSSSESEGDAVDSSVKILINDVTPCDSREFLHLPSILLQCPIPMQADKLPEKGPLQRRASWTCSRNPETVVKITRCWSLGVLITDLEHAIKRTTEEIIFRSRFSTTKEGSSDSIPDGIKDKQRSFSAGSGDDVFNFCNQLQDSVQSMNDVMPSNQARSLSISIGEPKVAKKNSLTALESKNSGKEEWLIAPRSTLQKSVSTPSIVAAQEIQEIADKEANSSLLIPSGELIFTGFLKKVTSAEPTKTSSSSSNILETNSASMESLDDGCQGTSDVEDETMLQLLDDEPESWNGTVDKKILKKLKDKDLKRQEAIYDVHVIILSDVIVLLQENNQKYTFASLDNKVDLQQFLQKDEEETENLLVSYLDQVSVLKRKLMQLKEMDGDCHGDRELSCSDSSLHIKSLVHHHLSVYRKEYGKRRYRPDHQLEELRNIQEKLSQERLQWEQEKAKKEKELEKKKQELLQMEKRICGEQASTDFNKLTCNFPDQVCDHNCPSLSLCRHRRSASFDFRTLGNLTHDVGGRQSWSGPIDDASLSWHQHFCATQSTSNIPQAVISVPTAPHSNQNSHDKSPEANSSPGTDSRRVSASDGASSPSITKNCASLPNC
ncbi:hypothetical protein HNY73_009361 [Argiope bruennichi]|uniref:Uncharacterized protein n=1 Tax=Argiope bruennichi TaxID=94029 RepID=A0A8T0FEG9_ARGBR|nr:hypothetical protein HNY73_009361 [Argiope bruennichi]